jgi:hypothetical protein
MSINFNLVDATKIKYEDSAIEDGVLMIENFLERHKNYIKQLENSIYSFDCVLNVDDAPNKNRISHNKDLSAIDKKHFQNGFFLVPRFNESNKG